MRSPAVNALIVGTQKGGTTALFEFLATHPRICTPIGGAKEIHFFDKNRNYALGPPDYGGYEARFPRRWDVPVWMEATPNYMWRRQAPARMAAYNPAMKLIMILRDPVERAISQWEQQYAGGIEPEVLEVALQTEQDILRRSLQNRIRSYVGRGLYAQQVRRLLRHFPREQMLFLRREDLLARHEATLDQACEFLGVGPMPSYPPPRMVYPLNRPEKALPPVRQETRDWLRQRFDEDLGELKALTGLDTDPWRLGARR